VACDFSRRANKESKQMEMREEAIKREELLRLVKEAVRELVPDAEIILYGSRARGTARADSDWDFLILLPSPAESDLERQIRDRLYDVELETDTVLSSIILSRQEWLSERYEITPFRREIERDGIAV